MKLIPWAERFRLPLDALGQPVGYFLGHKPREVACIYPQHIDVCMLPYKMNDYTKYIYPLKLHECLDGGRPIVGRPIRSLLDFAHVIKLANNARGVVVRVDRITGARYGFG